MSVAALRRVNIVKKSMSFGMDKTSNMDRVDVRICLPAYCPYSSGSFTCFCIPPLRILPSHRTAVERPTSQSGLHMVRKRVRTAAHVRINTCLEISVASQRRTDDVHHADNTCRARCFRLNLVDSSMDPTVMWLWRPHYIHSKRLREARSEATRARNYSTISPLWPEIDLICCFT